MVKQGMVTGRILEFGGLLADAVVKESLMGRHTFRDSAQEGIGRHRWTAREWVAW